MNQAGNKTSYFRKLQASAMNRMAPTSLMEKDSLTYWRVRILFAIIFSGVLLGFFTFLPVIILVIKENLWSLLIFNGIGWLIGLFLLFLPGLPYEIRAAVASLIIYAIGLCVIIYVGPLSGGPAWLFGFAVLRQIYWKPLWGIPFDTLRMRCIFLYPHNGVAAVI